MKILVIGDLHGKKPVIKNKDFDIILCVGDFCKDPFRKYVFQEIEQRKKNTKNKTKWYDILGREKVKTITQESLKNTKKILDYLNTFNKPTYIVPGNSDIAGYPKSKWEYLRENHFKKILDQKNIINTHNNIVNAGKYEIIGYGNNWEPEIPHESRVEWYGSKLVEEMKKTYEKQKKLTNNLFEQARKPVILLTHNVPYNTPLDKINNQKSPEHGKHFGSIIVKEMIEKYQPILQVGGHIHENYGKHEIGKTLCVNAGYQVLTKIQINKKIINVKFNC